MSAASAGERGVAFSSAGSLEAAVVTVRQLGKRMHNMLSRQHVLADTWTKPASQRTVREGCPAGTTPTCRLGAGSNLMLCCQMQIRLLMYGVVAYNDEDMLGLMYCGHAGMGDVAEVAGDTSRGRLQHQPPSMTCPDHTIDRA